MRVTIPIGQLHPRHGTHEPVTGTLVRTAGSVRRTTTIDMLRPDGASGPLVLSGRGRDLRTQSDGSAEIAAEATAYGVVDFAGGRLLREFSTDPVRPGLARLLGERVSTGFRGRMDSVDPTLPAEHGLLYQLLDDFPVATLVSGHAVAAAAPAGKPLPMAHRPAFKADICAGFAQGGTIMSGVEQTGRPPVVTGPAAPPLAVDGDPLAWHDTPPLPAQAMRRARRIDVRPGEQATVDAFFRDSYVRQDGLETVIHEYTLTARIEGHPEIMASCEVRARVLPWVECPAVVASAGRLAGVPLTGLRQHVRDTFTGTSTCTHLNDMLRALEGVASLLADADHRTV